MKLRRPFVEEINLQYLLDLPENYSSEKNWPLVIFLHGYGERGDNLELVRKHGLPKLAGEGQQFPFVLASPQCPAEFHWRSSFIISLAEELLENHSIDPNRVYLTGLSMGGYGTWQAALGISREVRCNSTYLRRRIAHRFAVYGAFEKPADLGLS
jgi:predicted peptidase